MIPFAGLDSLPSHLRCPLQSRIRHPLQATHRSGRRRSKHQFLVVVDRLRLSEQTHAGDIGRGAKHLEQNCTMGRQGRRLSPRRAALGIVCPGLCWVGTLSWWGGYRVQLLGEIAASLVWWLSLSFQVPPAASVLAPSLQCVNVWTIRLSWVGVHGSARWSPLLRDCISIDKDAICVRALNDFSTALHTPCDFVASDDRQRTCR
jgi:hypothetical protein